jgi:ribosomal protein S18 acetylase RimI-like enzyme
MLHKGNELKRILENDLLLRGFQTIIKRSKMTYRKVKNYELKQIAVLHAKSWQVAYKGILSDAFLENDVLPNRLHVWTERFAKRERNRVIYVAVDKQIVKGFVCVYGNDDAKWGALIDNLHVLPELKGQGIGQRLMKKAAKWVSEKYPNPNFYLWVYEDNHAARRFYEKMGGEHVETQMHDNPDNSSSNVLRYTWRELSET